MRLLLFVIILILSNFNAQSQVNLYANPVSQKDTANFILGGYGEVLYQHMNYGANRFGVGGSQSDNRALIDIPRMVLAFDYRFKNGFAVSSEIEFEHGGTGTSVEYEYDESGEWETEVEKGGEVALEQFYLSKYFSSALSVKVGHLIVPVGLTNTSHLPTQFFGTSRPEGENTILPLTWHETGVSILGRIKRWSYEAQLINGLDANGMTSEFWIKKARQSQYETIKMTSPAFVLRVNNQSINRLKLGASFYIGNTTKNSSKPEKMEHVKGTVTICTFDALYRSKNLIFRGNLVYGNLSDSEEISALNNSILSRYSPYTRTPVAKNALTYSAELGYNISTPLNVKGKLFPFIRYEYYNAMYKVEGVVFQNPIYNRAITTFGLNYFPASNIVLKADYAFRAIDKGNYNRENTLGISIGYYGLFFKK
jgi:hypothetical protein